MCIYIYMRFEIYLTISKMAVVLLSALTPFPFQSGLVYMLIAANKKAL